MEMLKIRVSCRSFLSAIRYPLSAHRNRGFTLIEIMLVVIIIAILAAIVMPRLGGRSEQAKQSRAKADISNISVALGLYELDLGGYPQNLEALAVNPGAGSDWRGPYLDQAPADPWGRPYQYQAPGKHNANKFDLSSAGKDGTESEDDIGNW